MMRKVTMFQLNKVNMIFKISATAANIGQIFRFPTMVFTEQIENKPSILKEVL